MNKKDLLFILLGEVIFGITILFSNYTCPFKLLFSIPCPFCGLTRSFFSLFRFDIASSLYYNFLGIILFVLLVVFNIIVIIDLLFSKNNTLKFVSIIKKYCWFFIPLLVISFIVNIIHCM